MFSPQTGGNRRCQSSEYGPVGIYKIPFPWIFAIFGTICILFQSKTLLYLPCCCKSRGRPRSKASKGEAVVFYCELLATNEMGHHRLSLRVKNMTNFLFVLEVTKSLFANNASTYSNALLSFFFSIPYHVFYATAGSIDVILRDNLAMDNGF